MIDIGTNQSCPYGYSEGYKYKKLDILLDGVSPTLEYRTALRYSDVFEDGITFGIDEGTELVSPVVPSLV